MSPCLYSYLYLSSKLRGTAKSIVNVCMHMYMYNTLNKCMKPWLSSCPATTHMIDFMFIAYVVWCHVCDIVIELNVLKYILLYLSLSLSLFVIRVSAVKSHYIKLSTCNNRWKVVRKHILSIINIVICIHTLCIHNLHIIIIIFT